MNTTQTEMFPKTELDHAHAVLTHLINEEEKAQAAVENAEKKYGEATDRVLKQRQVIAWLQDKMPAAEPTVECEDAEYIDEDHQLESTPLEIEGAIAEEEVVETDAELAATVEVDPITGEVFADEDDAA